MAHFAVIYPKRPDLRFAFRYRQMSGTIVSHEDDIIVEIHRVILSERSTRAERVHDLHGLRVLDLALTGDRNAAGCKKAGTENDGTDHIFIRSVAGSLIVVGHRSQRVTFNQAV